MHYFLPILPWSDRELEEFDRYMYMYVHRRLCLKHAYYRQSSSVARIHVSRSEDGCGVPLVLHVDERDCEIVGLAVYMESSRDRLVLVVCLHQCLSEAEEPIPSNRQTGYSGGMAAHWSWTGQN